MLKIYLCIRIQNNIIIFVRSSATELMIEIRNAGYDFQGQKIHQIVNNCDWIKQQFNTGREDIALGLRVAKELIEMHGGRIWIDQGTILFFTIPKTSVLNEELIEEKSFEKMASTNIY